MVESRPLIRYFSQGSLTGYGMAAVQYVKSLKRLGFEVEWHTILLGYKTQFGCEKSFADAIPEFEDSPPTNFNRPASINIFHTPPNHYGSLLSSSPNKLSIGMTVWETDTLPQEWIDPLNSMGHVIVPCHWNKKVFIKGGITRPIYILPHYSEFGGERVSNLISETNFNINKSDFVFLSVGVWENRKNFENLVETYLKTFKGNSNALLVLKTSKKDITRSLFSVGKYNLQIETKRVVSRIIKKIGLGSKSPRVMVIGKKIESKLMNALYSRCNAYITLSHGEGWGLGTYESAWHSKPIIATNHGGYLDFLEGDYFYPVDYQMTKVNPNFYERNNLSSQYWASPDLNHASELMKMIYEQYPKALEKGNNLKNYVKDKFSQNRIDKIFRAILEHIENDSK